MEFRWSNLWNWIRRGYPGRYLDSSHFYRMMAESAFPLLDGSTWDSHPGDLNGYGQPSRTSANSTLASLDWTLTDHAHTYGTFDYYFMSGDETVHDSILEGQISRWLTNTQTLYTSPSNGALYTDRATGNYLKGAVQLSQFLNATGASSNGTIALSAGTATYAARIAPQLCLDGYPSGCSTVLGNGAFGISRVRGVPYTGFQGLAQTQHVEPQAPAPAHHLRLSSAIYLRECGFCAKQKAPGGASTQIPLTSCMVFHSGYSMIRFRI